MNDVEILYTTGGLTNAELSAGILGLIRNDYYGAHITKRYRFRSEYQDHRFREDPNKVFYLRDVRQQPERFLEECSTGLDLLEEAKVGLVPSSEDALDFGFSIEDYSMLFGINWVNFIGRKSPESRRGNTFTLSQAKMDLFLELVHPRGRSYLKRLYRMMDEFNSRVLRDIADIFG